MKTIFTLFFSVLFTIAAIAAPATDARREGKLTVSMEGYSDVKVDMDGKIFTSSTNELVIRNLDPGYHDVIIYKESQNIFSQIFGRRYDVVYNGSLIIRPGTHVMASIDRFGRAKFNEQKIVFKQRGNDWYDEKDDRFDRRDDHRYDEKRHEDDHGIRRNDYARPMYQSEFERVKQMMAREFFESNRVKSAKQIINNNFFTSRQVGELVSLFQYESNKLELAKMAYAKTIDPQHYNEVVDKLTFRSSKEELNRYTRMFRY